MSDKDLVERPEDGPEDDREQTLVAHLIELRSRIVRMAVSVLLVFCLLVAVHEADFRLPE